MMCLVDVFVEELVVEKSMWVVETDFIYQNANEKMKENFIETWNFSEVLSEPFRFFQIVAEISYGHANCDLIEDDNFHGIFQGATADRFVGVWLNFIFPQRFWYQIHACENSTQNPIDTERKRRRAHNVNIEMIFTGHVDDFVPQFWPEIFIAF